MEVGAAAAAVAPARCRGGGGGKRMERGGHPTQWRRGEVVRQMPAVCSARKTHFRLRVCGVIGMWAVRRRLRLGPRAGSAALALETFS